MKTKNNFSLQYILINYALYIIMVLMILVIGIMSPRFFSLRVLRDILMQSSTRIIVAMGCMYILVSGAADLSGGRTVGLAAVVAGSLAQKSDYYIKFWPNLPEMPLIVPIFAAILIGLMIGLSNGFVTAKLKVPSFLATLSVMMVAYGANQLYCNKAPNNSQPLGGFLKTFSELGIGSFLNIRSEERILFISLFLSVFFNLFFSRKHASAVKFSLADPIRKLPAFPVSMFSRFRWSLLPWQEPVTA